MEKTTPTLDFERLSALSEEERTAEIAAYTATVEGAAAEAARAELQGELSSARYAVAKYRLCADESLCGFGERMEAIEEILASTPALNALSDEERLRTAYYIDRGKQPASPPTAEALVAALQSSPEAMRMVEAAVLEKLRACEPPAFMATAGGASMPVTPQKKPKSIDEASALAKAAFGI